MLEKMAENFNTWISCTMRQPPVGVVVNTCIMDNKGIRNEGKLIRQGNLWFFEDMKMYVYYTPTHWQYLGA